MARTYLGNDARSLFLYSLLTLPLCLDVFASPRLAGVNLQLSALSKRHATSTADDDI